MSGTRVLLSEASSLTAREHVTVLGRSGVRVEAMSSDPFALCRWSRWVRRLHRCPPAGSDPLGYLDAVSAVLATGDVDALLPTHEQAWLFALARDRLPAGAPVALAPAAAFERVQSKIAFARLLDELDLPQPRWRLADASDALPYPYFLKSAYSTAGQGVRLVRDGAELRRALRVLRGGGGPLMAQRPAAGRYGQVQALFDHGRTVAAHTSVQAGTGVGGSAAARLSVDHAVARRGIERVGAALRWHGGLTMDYLHEHGEPVFIECNPRTVEPANAVASGVDLPALTIALATGRPMPDGLVVGRAGVRTHGTIALMLGAADEQGSRRAVLRALRDGVSGRGPLAGSREMLTPVRHDPPSLVPLLTVAATLLARPSSTAATSARTVAAYSVTPEAIALLATQRAGT